PELAQPPQPRVGSAPVGRRDAIRRDGLPQHRITQRTQAEPGEELEIVRAPGVAGGFDLIEIAVPHAIERAFEPTPDLDAIVETRGLGEFTLRPGEIDHERRAWRRVSKPERPLDPCCNICTCRGAPRSA